MDIKLSVNGVEKYVGIELLNSIASSLKDDESNQELFQELAKHPSANIRKEIAYKDNLLPETAKLLLKDSDVSVLSNITRSDIAKEILDEDDFRYLLSKNNEEIIENLISYISDYDLIDNKKEFYEEIINLNNDYLTLQIADNYDTPKSILKKLIKSLDPDISSAAKGRLD